MGSVTINISEIISLYYYWQRHSQKYAYKCNVTVLSLDHSVLHQLLNIFLTTIQRDVYVKRKIKKKTNMEREIINRNRNGENVTIKNPT